MIFFKISSYRDFIIINIRLKPCYKSLFFPDHNYILYKNKIYRAIYAKFFNKVDKSQIY